MGISDDIGDPAFDAGMLAGAQALGDPGTTASGKFTPDWVPAFKQDVRDLFESFIPIPYPFYSRKTSYGSRGHVSAPRLL